MTMLKKKHGFTLVELIVVLVILAILLALLVPALTQWIEKARDKQILIDARTAYLAVQTLEDEEYGANRSYEAHKHVSLKSKTDSTNTGTGAAQKLTGGTDSKCEKTQKQAVGQLADISGEEYTVAWETSENGKIVEFKYEIGNRQVHLHGTELVCEADGASCGKNGTGTNFGANVGG